MKKIFAVTLLFVMLAGIFSFAEEQPEWNLNEMIHPKLKEYFMAAPESEITNETLSDLRKIFTIQPEAIPVNERVEVRNVNITPELRVRIYTPKVEREKYPALLWIHGGGHLCGTPEANEDLLLRMADEAGCMVIAPDYRLAPEYPYPADVDDCYNTLIWLTENLPVDKEKTAVVGMSAGGGVAAAVTLMARDRKGPSLCFQMLLYPMLDYRNITPSSFQIRDYRAWCRDANVFAWNSYLANVSGDVPAYASPSMAKDLSGLPPAYVLIYGLDPFRDEDMEYAQRLMQAGVAVEVHVIPGTVHAFEVNFSESELSVKTINEYINKLAEALSYSK